MFRPYAIERSLQPCGTVPLALVFSPEARMNHVSRDFSPGDGRKYRMHHWELRQGGYRRIALYWGNGLWPPERETRLLGFLIGKGFKVAALDLAFGSAIPPFAGLKAFRRASAAFVEEMAASGLPLYAIASSFSASALLPVLDRLGRIEAAALIAPVLRFPNPAIRAGLPCFGHAGLRVDEGMLSGEPALLDGLMDQARQHRFKRRDLRVLASEDPLARAAALAGRAAVFAGEDDPLVGHEELVELEGGGVKAYSYPRSRRELGRDRYADNFFADLGSFLDEAEVRSADRR